MKPKESPSPSTKSSTGGTDTTTTPVGADVAATPPSKPVADNTTTATTTTDTSPSAPPVANDADDTSSEGKSTTPGDVADAANASPSKNVESTTTTTTATKKAATSPSSPTDADDTPAIEEGTSNPNDGADVATASPPQKSGADDTTTETTTQTAAGSTNADDKDTAAASTSPTIHNQNRRQKKKSVPSASPKENSKKKTKTNSAPPKDDSKTKTKYFAVRKCESLESPAIFSNLKDCNFYVDMDNDETTADKNEHHKTGKTRVQYQSFGSLDEAIGYAFPQEEQRQPPVQKKNSKNAAAGNKVLIKELQKSNSREAKLQKEIDKLKEALKQEKDKFASSLEKATARAKDRVQKDVKRERNAHIKVVEQLKTRHEAALEREQKRSLKAIEKQAKKLMDYKQRQAKKKRSLLELEGEQANGNETDASNSNTPLKRPRVEKTHDNRDNQQHLKWKIRYEQLVAYKEEYGDCNVSVHDRKRNVGNNNMINRPQTPELKALGVWITTQRTAYRKLIRGLPTSMTRERIELLENLGFVWSLGPEVLPFEKRVEQLKEYRDEHGHCNVPQKTGPLGEWIMNTRKLYREQRLPADKIAILEEVGMQWSLRNRGGPLELRMRKVSAANAEQVAPGAASPPPP